MRGFIWINFELPFSLWLSGSWVSMRLADPPLIVRARPTEGMVVHDFTTVLRGKAENEASLSVLEEFNTARSTYRSASFAPVAYAIEGVLEDGSKVMAEAFEIGPGSKRRQRWDFTEVDVVYSAHDLPSSGELEGNRIDALFDEGVAFLSPLLRHYRCMVGDYRVRPVSVADLQTARLWWRPAESSEHASGVQDLLRAVAAPEAFLGKTKQPETPIVKLRIGKVYGPRHLDAAVMKALETVCTTNVPSPLHVELLLEAIRILHEDGESTVALVVGETALEVLLRRCVLAELMRRGGSVADAETALEANYGGPVRKLDFLNAVLAGKGTAQLDGRTVDTWKKDTYVPRKGVIHEGATVELPATVAALQALAGVIQVVEDAFPPEAPFAKVVGLPAMVRGLLA